MSEQPSVPRHRSLSECLQSVTEALAATRTLAEVFGIVLHPALQALGAVAGVVLLVNDRGDRLEVAATQGYAEGEQTLWQSGALDDVAPAIDALRRREPVYFERQAALIAAYPDLAAPPGGVAVVATAVTPMVLDRQALGVIVLAFTEPHHFTPEERRFLETLAAQCALALDRLQLTTQLRQQVEEVQLHADTLSAFMALTEAVGTETDLSVLALRAMEVIQAALPELSVAYYDLEGGLWKPRVLSEDIQPEIVVVLRAGLPLETPSYAAAVRARGPVFTEGWDAETQGIAHSESYGVGAFYPFFQQGEPSGMFVIGTQQTRVWTTRDRAMFTAVGRSLNLALERAEHARQLEQERNALAAFTAFTEAVGSQTDVTSLAKQAFSVLESRFQDFSSGYNVLEDGLWKLQMHTDDLNANPELLAVLRAGLPQDTPSLLKMVQERTEVFTDAQALEDDGIEHSGAYGAGGSYPLIQGGEVRAFLGFGLRNQRHWSERDRALVRAVGRGLQLALERSEMARSLQVQNAELDARTRALEGFAGLTREQAVQRDPYALIRRAGEVVLSQLTAGYALYYELDGERWRSRVQVSDIGNADLQAFVDAGPLVGTIPSLDRPWTRLEALYQNVYAHGSDSPVELVQHVNAVACLPVLLSGEPVGIFAVGLFEQRSWTGTDRVVLEAVVGSLGLALERAQGVAELAARSQALERSNEQLEAANGELEAFGYSVSHDLRTPVRHIKGFNKLLRQALGTPLEAKATRYLGIVDEAAGRMNAMIDAMLELSRTSRQPLRMGPVDLETLVAATRSEVEVDAQGRQVVWKVQPLPLVMGDQDTLRQVMVNLLSNALKYSRDEDQALIEVWAEGRLGEWAVFVRDNGAGFDPRYQDRLFGVFQRLHRHEDFEGIGVGLVNVRRIILRHGGTVFAHSEVGQGATFGFTLPRAP
jgi:signal transduction histidine kinase